MGPKSIKNLIEIRLDFCNDLECPFFRSGIDFGSRNLSKMRDLRVTFSTSLRICEKCDFEQHSNGLAIFFDFRRVDFQPQNVDFSDVFQRCFQHVFFRFWAEIGTKFSAKWDPKSI